MTKKPVGWKGDAYRHSLSARGIKNKSLDDRFEVHKNKRYRELHDREHGIIREEDYNPIENEYFFNENDELCVYDPYEYLEVRYNVPLNLSKTLTLLFYRDEKGREGVPKSMLDSIGEAFKQPKRYQN